MKVTSRKNLRNVTLKQLRAEYKAYGQSELMYDVYSDRINFIGQHRWIVEFFYRRNVIADLDRAGVSINIADATALSFPTQESSYRFQCRDLRRKG
ncbi:MAG: hypothetical protein AAGF24_05315 [Cyanobacteria bacterium P01_H01_bin.121]